MGAKADAQKVAKAVRHRQHAAKIEQFKVSGMEASEWCKKEGVSLSTLYRWQKEAREDFLATSEGQEMAAQLLPEPTMLPSVSPQPQFNAMCGKTFGERYRANRMEAVAEWKRSKLSATEWCRQQGIPRTTFQRWKEDVREMAEEYEAFAKQSTASSQMLQPRFTELPALPPAANEPSHPVPASGETAIRIQMGGMVIEIQKEADARLTESVVRALAKQC